MTLFYTRGVSINEGANASYSVEFGVVGDWSIMLGAYGIFYTTVGLD